MRLVKALDDYAAQHEYGLRLSTLACCYMPAIKDLTKYLGRDPMLADLDRFVFNDWVADMLKRLAMPSVRNRRGAVLAIWRWAWDADLAPNRPEKLRKLRMRRKPVEAWSRDQIGDLLRYVETQHVDRVLPRAKVHSRPYWSTLIRAAYDTGLRLGDLLSLTVNQIETCGSVGLVTLSESKTGNQALRRLSEPTMRAMDAYLADKFQSDLVWPLWSSRRQFYVDFKALVKGAGLKGTFRYLRRSGATHVEASSPGQGYRHTNHASPDTTYRHYIDRSQLTAQIVAPQPLDS